MLAPSVAHLSFVRGDGLPLDYIPGQFIQVHFAYADGTPTKRSYSLATIHDHALGAGEAVEIAVSYVPCGAATALFEGLEIGGSVQASGPFGRFCLMPQDANRRYLLIATGTGVTPYRAMLPLLARQIAERGIGWVLLFGARPAELLYGDEFRAFADAHPAFRFRAVLLARAAGRSASPTRATATCGSSWASSSRTRPPTAYLCGNPNMVDACFEQLKAAGLPIPQIRRENTSAANSRRRTGRLSRGRPGVKGA